MLRKTFFALVAAAVLLTLNPAANAAPLVVGNANGNLATAEITSYGFDARGDFAFTIRNTSPHDARITAVGFDLPGASRTGFSLAGTSSGNFRLETDPGNVPQFNSAALDFALVTGNSGNFNGGSPNKGIAPGATATFTVSGNFANLSAERIIGSIFVRFQRVGPGGELSDVGTAVPGAPNNPVPEPATMLLMGTGLAGVAAKMRRRGKTKPADSEDLTA